MFLKTLTSLVLAATASALATTPAVEARVCSPRHIAPPSIPDGLVLNLSTVPASYNYTGSETTGTVDPSILHFCNVTVTYTHPGKNDTIHTTVWLPFANWNGRLQGSGGGGYATRSDDTKLGDAVVKNYSVVATDGGHAVVSQTSTTWSLDADNNVNMALLEDFAYIALADAATIGKQISHSFYGRPPRHAYWNGCSTGGRQGLILAQRFPTAYNGIMAAAPAINWPSFLVAEYWPQFVMNQLQTYPATCVTDAITAATIEACDALDGVSDGVISSPDLCDFDPRTLVGTPAHNCTPAQNITRKDAEVVRRTWEGLRAANGSFLWYGLNPGAPLSRGASSLAHTTCTSSTNCTGTPFPISADWIKQFVLQDPSFDLTSFVPGDLDRILASSKARYNHIIGTDNPDLSAFKRAGGKMITWHGLADQLIFPKGTEQYYRRVEARDPTLRDFYRFFEAPGVYHCHDGPGAFPTDPLSAVVDWVENGMAPESIDAKTADGSERVLCPYPLVAVYQGGDVRDKASYECAKGY
ncbi:hypothetical protein FE257_010600 [Aspergillus nanangensis]|uniref:Carboxylic ester hydrolase n=1 Tax=Aspergillus nanangensis TaxID=2582783 RepID=A0AAD4CIH7_ASPNN|nr:hypothetical protein FE257_010600 [Aspergillus nanangensis]